MPSHSRGRLEFADSGVVLFYLTAKMKIESNLTPRIVPARYYRRISSDAVARIIDGQLFGRDIIHDDE